MWANDPEMAEKWENEEKSESRKMRVTESNLRSIIRRTLLAEQDVTAAIKMLMDTLDDNQKAELTSAMGDPSKPSGTSGTSAPEESSDDEGMMTGDISPEALGSILDDPENQDAAKPGMQGAPGAPAKPPMEDEALKGVLKGLKNGNGVLNKKIEATKKDLEKALEEIKALEQKYSTMNKRS